VVVNGLIGALAHLGLGRAHALSSDSTKANTTVKGGSLDIVDADGREIKPPKQLVLQQPDFSDSTKTG
jgi:hypothetical protein